MGSLLEKARTRSRKLSDLPAHPASVGLKKYRNFLKLESHRLRMAHRAGEKGMAIARARASVLDLAVQCLFEETSRVLPRPPGDTTRLALVAYGGYGRGTLNPCSDLDLMLLHDRKGIERISPRPWALALGESFFLSLTDIRLKILPVTRSIPDCIRVANDDMQSRTALIETRLVTGDRPLYEEMTRTILNRCVTGKERVYITSRLEDQKARRLKHGDSPYLQEPNIKNGCGGLRDYQNLLWMAFFKKRCRTMEDLLEQDLVDSSEYRQLTRAYDYLMRVRNEMHYLTGRPEDVLRRSLQPRVAFHLGFTDRSPSRRLEAFMQRVYGHLRVVYLLSKTLEERMALFPANRLARIIKIRKPILLDGFEFRDGEVLLANPRAFREQPRRLMRVFRHAQQRGLRLHPELAYTIRSQITLADRAFLRDINVRETFIEILDQRGDVGRCLRVMHETGLLGKYLPEFGKLTGLVQHEFYHMYTADEHTIVCLEQLDRVWEARDTSLKYYARIFENLDRPWLLYLALVLHDAGKADASAADHTGSGVRIAQRVGRRLELASRDARTLRFLVREHLSMAQISQRRDIEDPAIIESFAERVEESENLDMLTLMTFSDSMATSREMWNGFKDTLLRTLHLRSHGYLTGDTTERIASRKLRSWRRRETNRLLPDRTPTDEVDAHFTHLPDRYFRIHSPREIAEDIDRVHQFIHRQTRPGSRPLEPVFSWKRLPNRGYTLLKVVTWDYSRVFSRLAGALTASGILIQGAHVFTRADGMVLDTFTLVDNLTGTLVATEKRRTFAAIACDILSDRADPDDLIARAPRTMRLYHSIEGDVIKPRIEFDNITSERCTIIDIEAEDRPGLLYAIAAALNEMNLYISVARISTERGAAIDTFYVMDPDGEKIREAADLERTRRGLARAIRRVNAPVSD